MTEATSRFMGRLDPNFKTLSIEYRKAVEKDYDEFPAYCTPPTTREVGIKSQKTAYPTVEEFCTVIRSFPDVKEAGDHTINANFLKRFHDVILLIAVRFTYYNLFY
uniref:Uncharacterized protein n=1 Tax=Caenorhabditis japonica TaxID=281687 RepID=A0A8R1E4W6_CAEJA